MGAVEYFYSEKEAKAFANKVRDAELSYCGFDDEGNETWEVFYKPNDLQ